METFYLFDAELRYTDDTTPVVPPDGRTHPGGEIPTADGAVIRWDAKGYGLRGADPSQPHRWRMASALVFDTDDTRYAWLNRAMAVWHGEFDERIGVARHTAWVAAGDVPAALRTAA